MDDDVEWCQPNARCPECRKSMALRFAKTLTILCSEMIELGAASDQAIVSYKCQGCRSIYPVTLETVAHAAVKA